LLFSVSSAKPLPLVLQLNPLSLLLLLLFGWLLLLLLFGCLLQAKAALLEHIAVHGSLAVPHEHLRAALGLPPSSSLASPERALALKKVRWESIVGKLCIVDMLQHCR
jgi:cell division septal protein FtsQ